MPGPDLADETPSPGAPRARMIASGVAVLLHGGLAGLLLLSPATSPSPVTPDAPPVIAVVTLLLIVNLKSIREERAAAIQNKKLNAR